MSGPAGPSDEPVSAGYLALGTLLAERYRIDAEIGEEKLWLREGSATRTS